MKKAWCLCSYTIAITKRYSWEVPRIILNITVFWWIHLFLYLLYRSLALSQRNHNAKIITRKSLFHQDCQFFEGKLTCHDLSAVLYKFCQISCLVLWTSNWYFIKTVTYYWVPWFACSTSEILLSFSSFLLFMLTSFTGYNICTVTNLITKYKRMEARWWWRIFTTNGNKFEYQGNFTRLENKYTCSSDLKESLHSSCFSPYKHVICFLFESLKFPT